jgi:serine/threonine protein kinase
MRPKPVKVWSATRARPYCFKEGGFDLEPSGHRGFHSVANGDTHNDSAGPTDAPPHSNANLAPFTRIGRYVIVAPLGRGGLGVVYAAYDHVLDRQVALKFFEAAAALKKAIDHADPSALAAERSAGRRMVWLEARALAKFMHPNVVPIYEAGIHSDSVYIAMELIRGHSLRAHLKEKVRHPKLERIPRLDDRLNWLAQCAQGLAAIHRAGFVHGDFKPDNVMVGDDGQVRIVDFGLAHDVEQSAVAANDSRANEPAGTRSYLAPERFAGAVPSIAADVFAFGVTSLEVLRSCVKHTKALPSAQDPQRERLLQEALREITRRVRLDREVYDFLRATLAGVPGHRDLDLDRFATRIVRADADKKVGTIATFSLAAFLLIAVFVGMILARSVANECASAPLRMSEVWSPEIRGELHRHFAGLARDDAASTGTRVIEEIDGWSANWMRSFVDTCNARAEVGESWGSGHSLESAVCYQSRLDDLRNMISALRTVDTSSLDKALVVLESLAAPDTCALQTRREFRLEMPHSPLARSQAEEMWQELRYLRVRNELGLAPEEAAISKDLRQRLDELNWPPLQAAARSTSAEALVRTWKLRETQAVAARAFFANLALDQSELAARSLGIWAFSNAYETGTNNIIDELIPLTISTLARQDLDPRMKARIYSWLSSAVSNHGEEARSLQLNEEAARILDSDIHVAGSILRERIRSNAGNSRVMLGSYEEGISECVQAQRGMKRLLGPMHPELGGALWCTALGYAGLGEYGNALADIDRGEAIFVASDGPMPRRAIPFYHYRLDVWRGEGRFLDIANFGPNALEVFARTFGADHVRPLGIALDIAAAEIRVNRVDLAKSRIDHARIAIKEFPELAPLRSRIIDLELRLALARPSVAIALPAIDDALIAGDIALRGTLYHAMLRMDHERERALQELIALPLEGWVEGEAKTARVIDIEVPLIFALLAADRVEDAQRRLDKATVFVARSQDPNDRQTSYLRLAQAALAHHQGEIGQALALLQSASESGDFAQSDPAMLDEIASLRARIEASGSKARSEDGVIKE